MALGVPILKHFRVIPGTGFSELQTSADLRVGISLAASETDDYFISLKQLQSIFSGSNTFGTIKICSR